MMTNDDEHVGSTAFPVIVPGYEPYSIGMSLRDWFAGQALAGMCAADRRWEGDEKSSATDKSAQAAYSHADAMLKARSE